MTPGEDAERVTLARALRDPGVLARYAAKIRRVDGSQCWWWVGAIASGSGHGRLWLGPGRAVIAHRVGYALAHGPASLTTPAGTTVLLGHECDNTLCQRPGPGHVLPSSPAQNTDDWRRRRQSIGSPLRDVRGAHGRAVAARAAILAGTDLQEALDAGLSILDRDQLSLFDDELMTGEPR